MKRRCVAGGRGQERCVVRQDVRIHVQGIDDSDGGVPDERSRENAGERRAVGGRPERDVSGEAVGAEDQSGRDADIPEMGGQPFFWPLITYYRHSVHQNLVFVTSGHIVQLLCTMKVEDV